MEHINWTLIADGVKYYNNHGFDYLETPWVTPVSTLMITCPREENVFAVTGHGGLVGSAEQGFLDMALNQRINTDRGYVSAGPCFRNEEIDRLHQPQFFKVELFYHTRHQERAAEQAKLMLNTAYGFMLLRSPDARPVVVDEGFGWDININGIEVGSYGYRYHERLGFWAYGTGVAEPRFSQATRA